MTTRLRPRAEHYARVVITLMARQGLSGGSLTTANRGARHLSLGLKLRDTTELDKAIRLAEAIAMAANVNAVLATRRAGQLIYQFQLNPGFWQSYTRADLPDPGAMGLGEQRKPVKFTFNKHPHALIAGTSGSGKTETTNSVLISLMTTSTPNKLGVILVNPKRDMTGFENAAHLLCRPAYTQDDSRVAIAYAEEHLKQRIDGSYPIDRSLLLVIDEPNLVGLNEETLACVQNIAKVGRSFRVHLLVSTQKPSHKELPKILDQLLNRFIGQVSDSSISAMLTGHGGLQAHKLTGKGDFIHIQGPETERFQVALATPADYDRLPRAEAAPLPPANQPEPLTRLPDVVEEPNPGGRPRLELDPELLAHYFYHHPDQISRNQARKLLGLTRSHHELHRDFCRAFISAYLQLRHQTKMLGA